MLAVFLPIFVTDTKITFVYDFAAPLIVTKKHGFTLSLGDTIFKKPQRVVKLTPQLF